LEGTVAIYRRIASGHFGPDEIEAMTKAYELALAQLGLQDRNDPFTEIVARAIVTVTQTGERDPQTVKDRALAALGASIAAVESPNGITGGRRRPILQ
jgi:hypothetical protein